jgi:hypothetical protein
LMNCHCGKVKKPEGVGGSCGCSKEQDQEDLSLYPTHRVGTPEYYRELRRHDIEWLRQHVTEGSGKHDSGIFNINRDYAARLIQIINEGEAARQDLIRAGKLIEL